MSPSVAPWLTGCSASTGTLCPRLCHADVRQAGHSAIVGKPEVEPTHPTPNKRDSSSGLLPTNLPLFPGGLQLPVPFRVDLLLPPPQHVLRRDVANGAVQT